MSRMTGSNDDRCRRSSSEWDGFFSNCFQKRLSPSDFSSLVPLMLQKSAAKSLDLCKAFVHKAFKQSDGDPLAHPYFERLLQCRAFSTCDVLTVLLASRNDIVALDSRQDAVTEGLSKAIEQARLEQTLLANISRMYSRESQPSINVPNILQDFSNWMSACVNQNETMVIYGGTESFQTLFQEILSSREALATLVVILTEKPSFVDGMDSVSTGMSFF